MQELIQLNTFNAIGRAIGKDVKKVDDVSDEIRNFLSTPKGQKRSY